MIENNYIIEKIFNVVAGNDYNQVIDCVTAHYPFCRRVFDKQTREENVINILSLASSHQQYDFMWYDCFLAKLVEMSGTIEEKGRLKKDSVLVYETFSLNGAWLVWHNWGKFISFLILGSAVLYIANVKKTIQCFYNDVIKK